MMRLRSPASTSTRWARSFSVQSAALRTAKAPGAWKRWPSVRSAATRPCPSSSPSRRSNVTTAPSSRQVMRRSGRTQVKPLVPPQRIDLGQGKRRSRGGMARGDQRRRRDRRGAPCPPPSNRLPRRSCSRVAPCLRRKPSSACGGALARGPAFGGLAGGDLGGHFGGQGDAARTVERLRRPTATAAPAPRRSAARGPPPRGPACGPEFPH